MFGFRIIKSGTLEGLKETRRNYEKACRESRKMREQNRKFFERMKANVDPKF